MKHFILGIALWLCAPLSIACSCDIGDVPEKFKEHESIFQGVATEIIFYKQKNGFGDHYIRVTFEIEKQWKGKASQHQLLTVYNGSSCHGYWFKEKERYLIYAFKEGDHLNAWWCGGVISESDSEASFKEEQKELNQLDD